jgi:hypothetical protein
MRSSLSQATLLAFALLAEVLAPSRAARAAAPPAPSALVIRRVAVIDTTGGPTLCRTVVIRGGRITAVGPPSRVAVPRRARVLDGSGKYLIPGLWDMHVHLIADEFAPLFLANGVTGVRHMLGLDPRFDPRRWRTFPTGRAPRLVAADQMLDGPQTPFPAFISWFKVLKARDES